MALPLLWGNIFWGLMHNLAATIQYRSNISDGGDYDDQSQEQQQQQQGAAVRAGFLAMLCSIPRILPCAQCKRNAPPIFAKRIHDAAAKLARSTCSCDYLDLTTFMWTLHNDVNKHLGKPQITLATARARAIDLRSVDTALVWRFIIVIVRTINMQSLTERQAFGDLLRCLTFVLRALRHESLSLAIADGFGHSLLSAEETNIMLAQKMFPAYKQWHDEHNLPCALSAADFIAENRK